MEQEYIQHAWESFSQADMSITKEKDGAGLGLTICKNLVEINGGEINVESKVGKGSKFSFTWNVELLKMASLPIETQFNDQIIYASPNSIKSKRILIIHPLENMRNSMLKYLKKIEKVDAFDTFDEGIIAAKTYKEINSLFAYDIVFIGLYENNKEEVINAVVELKEINGNDLSIIFIVFQSDEGIMLARELMRKASGTTSVIYTPITWI
ncbi:14216_t:CDS:1, partial [Racocetra persica]